MLKNKYLSLLLITMGVLFVSCNSDQNKAAVEDEHIHQDFSVTQYTLFTEIFMEYPSLLVNNEAKFLIHLTDIKNFKAVTKGELNITFSNENGDQINHTENAPTRPGIYIPVIKFSEPGTYKMEINLNGTQVSDKIIVPNIKVYSGHDEIKHISEEDSHSISFLKEQQWKIDFANEKVIMRKMQASVITIGEILSKPELFSKVVSPVSGIVLNSNNSQLKTVGSFVKKGTVLLNISPTADANESIQKIKNDYLLAKSEFERLHNLFEKKAISKKRLDESKFSYETKRLSFNSINNQVKLTDNGYAIVAPISGNIQSIDFSLGAQIDVGQQIFTIIDPSKLILQANVPSSQSTIANNSTDAAFTVEGMDSEFKISELKGKKLSVSAIINKANRTIPVYFDFYNPNNSIKVGMYAQVFLKVGSAKERLSIPESAIINTDGLQTAYVQVEGEAFEKRILKTGIVENGFVEIIEGLELGERIITKGAYQVRLAEISSDSEIGHGHVH